MEIEHFKHIAELYATAKGWQLSPFADKIIKRCLTACDGHCPCDVSRGYCPCKEHVQEVAEMGHCHCNLFVKKQD